MSTNSGPKQILLIRHGEKRTTTLAQMKRFLSCFHRTMNAAFDLGARLPGWRLLLQPGQAR